MYYDDNPLEYQQDLARALCQAMDFKNLNWGDWFPVLTALKSLGFSENEVMQMCEGSDKFNPSEFKSQWNSANGNYTIETIIGKAKIYAPTFDIGEFKKQWYKDNPQFSNNNYSGNNPARKVQPTKTPAAPMKEESQKEEIKQIENSPDFKQRYLELIQADINKSRGNLRDFINTCKEMKFRGLTFSTCENFDCGYIDNWTHPLTRAKIEFDIYKDEKTGKPKNPPPTSRRFIIPTIDGNHYNAVALPEDRKNIPESLCKIHAGEKPTFGVQTLTIETEIIFACESEIDCMSIWQAYKNFLPTNIKALGFIASLGISATKWRDDLDNFFASRAEKPIVIWVSDSDHKDKDAEILQDLLKRGFPAFVLYFSDENKKYDANEVLTQEGEDALLNKLHTFLQNAENNLDAVKAEIKALAEKAREEEKIKKLLELPLTDLDNARRIELMFSDIIRFNTTSENWGFYHDNIWTFETSANSALYPYTAEITGIIAKNVTDAENKNTKFNKDLLRSWCKIKTQRNAIEMVKGIRQMLITQKDLDAHHNLINCKNGVVVDLKTGKYYPASPTFYLTQQAGANYNPQWKEDKNHTVEKFLRDILPIEDYREFLLMWLAYSLTGEVNEEKFAFIKGLGGNGKGTLTKVALKMAGDYGCSFPIGGILARKNYDANAATTAINILENKRLAFGEEIPPNAKTDPAQIKILTGGDIVPARKNYSEYRNVNPTWKITFSGNNDLQFPDANDYGIKRRLVVIPFQQDFTLNPNLKLKEELLEQENIDYLFNKLVRLAVAWYKNGLYIPQTLKTVADDYLKAQDFIADFIDEYCERRAEGVISRKDFVEKLREVYSRETPTNNQTLKEMLGKIDGVEYTRDENGKILKGIVWRQK